MGAFREKRDGSERFRGFGQVDGGKVEMYPAVILRQVGSKKHSSVDSEKAWNGVQPTCIPGMTNTGGGCGIIICAGDRRSAAQA